MPFFFTFIYGFVFVSKSIHNQDLRREYSGQSPLSSLPDNTARQMTPLSYLQSGNTVVSSIHPRLADCTMKEQQQTGEVISAISSSQHFPCHCICMQQYFGCCFLSLFECCARGDCKRILLIKVLILAAVTFIIAHKPSLIWDFYICLMFCFKPWDVYRVDSLPGQFLRSPSRYCMPVYKTPCVGNPVIGYLFLVMYVGKCTSNGSVSCFLDCGSIILQIIHIKAN